MSTAREQRIGQHAQRRGLLAVAAGEDVRTAPTTRSRSPSRTASLAPETLWTPAYLAFLLYTFCITTYRLPLGTAAIVIGLGCLLFQRGQLRLPPFLVWYAVFIVWCTVSWAHSSFPEVSWETLKLAGKLWLILLVAVNALRSRGQVLFFAAFFLFCFFLYPVRGALTNLFVVGYSMDGRAVWNQAFSNPNDLGGVALLQLSMAIGLLFVGVGLRRWVAALTVVLLALLILLTQSRGAFVALCVLTLLTLALQRRRFMGLSIILGLGGILAVSVPSSAWQRLGGLRNATSVETLNAADSEGSAQQRFEIWKVASTVALEHPIFGVGVGAYQLAHGAVAARGEFNSLAGGQRDAHSTYLTAAAETGLPGLALFLLLVGSTLWRAGRAAVQSPLPWASPVLTYLIVGYVAFLVAGIWGSYNQLVYGFVHLALISALTEIAREAAPGPAIVEATPRASFKRGGLARAAAMHDVARSARRP